MLNIDWRKWFDRMQPQTLQVAAMLLYLNGFFAIVNVIDSNGYLGYIRNRSAIGLIVALIIVVLYALSGLLMANDLKLGYIFAVAAAFSPFALRFWAYTDYANASGVTYSLYRRLGGESTLNLIFEIALCALILHPQSRSHKRIWYR